MVQASMHSCELPKMTRQRPGVWAKHAAGGGMASAGAHRGRASCQPADLATSSSSVSSCTSGSAAAASASSS